MEQSFTENKPAKCIFDGEYTVSRKDISAMLRKAFLNCGMTYRGVLTLIVFSLWFIYILPAIKNNIIMSWIFGILLIPVIAAIWFYPLIFMRMRLKKDDPQKSDHLLHVMVFDTYMEVSENGVPTDFSFNKELEIYEDSKYYFIFLNKDIGTVLPKRIIVESKQQELSEFFRTSLHESYHLSK